MRGYRNVILGEAAYGGLPVGYWPLDEGNGTTARDLMAEAAGSGNSGTYGSTYTLGVAGPVNGEASAGVLLSTGYVDIGATPAALQLGSTWTLEIWLYPTAFDSFGGIITNAASFSRAAANYGLGFEGTTGTPQVTCRNNSGSLTHTNAMSLNQWSHLVATRSGTSFSLTLNNVTVTGTASVGSVSYTTEHTLIGGWTTGSGLQHGRYAHAAIYSYVLGTDRVTSHYLAGINGGFNRKAA